ncbi:hypothetical protein EVAR_44056_1 [Eumeta japonica]|uniref:Uncharacterized protein n=1 Tax=Eumeta variegata TaxID=151549 RepID=A0A4C1XIK4_EUMVA|nr:hypothetical protein EVAR_44056_1 [Eumeta japonica]
MIYDISRYSPPSPVASRADSLTTKSENTRRSPAEILVALSEEMECIYSRDKVSCPNTTNLEDFEREEGEIFRSLYAPVVRREFSP